MKKIVVIINVLLGNLLFCMVVQSSQNSIEENASPVGIMSTMVQVAGDIFGTRNESTSNSTESDDEDLAQTAIESYYPERYRNDSKKIHPYVLQALRRNASPTPIPREPTATTVQSFPSKSERIETVTNLRQVLRNVRSGEMSPNSERQHNDLQKLLLEACHEALIDKEKDLDKKEKELKHKEHKLEQKMSKKATALWSTISGFFATGITAMITYYSSCKNK